MGFFKNLFTPAEDIQNQALGSVKEQYKQENLDFKCMIPVDKVFGIDMEYDKIKYFMMFSDRIRFMIDNSKGLKTGVWIQKEDIKSIRIMNDVQIEEQSNLGKIMVFGILALGMKKNTKEVNNRSIVLNVEEDGVEYSVIIKVNEILDDKILEIAKRFNKWLKTGEFERVF